MSSGKRGAGGGGKRSGVMGMRVAAKKESTGWYEAATISEVGGADTSTPVGEAGEMPSSIMRNSHKLRLTFDDGSSGWYLERHIIGPGMSPPFLVCYRRRYKVHAMYSVLTTLPGFRNSHGKYPNFSNLYHAKLNVCAGLKFILIIFAVSIGH